MNRSTSERLIRGLIEAGFLLLLVLAPWPFGLVRPLPQAILYTGIAILLILWAIRLCLMEAPAFQVDTGLLCLTGLLLFNLFQTVPLPNWILDLISPHTNQLRHELIPQTPERLLGDAQPIPVPNLEQAQPLTFNTRVTESFAIPLFAILFVYALIRNNLSSIQARARFAWTAVVLGTVVAIFAFVQAVSSRYDEMYWTFKFESGRLFGPFMNRNHYTMFMHFCIGAAVGLLLETLDRHSSSSRRKRSWLDLFNILQTPRALWMMCALGMMLIATVYSQSRGGTLSIAAAILFASLVWWRRSSDRSQAWTLLLIFPIVIFALIWAGGKEFGSRLSVLTDKQALATSRLEIWQSFWPLVPEYPLAGTGGSTTPFVESLHREIPVVDNIWNLFTVTNEYLEALVEGGIIRLALMLILLVFLYRHGMRVVRSGDRKERGLTLGLLTGLVAVALHAFVEWGMHTPAVALMVVTGAAYLASAGRPSRPPMVLPRWGAATAALFLLASAVWLIMMGWHEEQLDRYQRAAERVAEGKDPGRWDLQIQYWQAAVELEPDNAVLRQRLGEACVNAYEEGREKRIREINAQQSAELIAAGISFPKPSLADLAIAYEMPRISAWDAERKSREKYLRPGLREWVISRNLCPLLYQPHTTIASYYWMFAAADPEMRYLDRAVRVFSSDPRLWYARGRLHLQQGKPDEAWADWRQSLTRSMKVLPEILLHARAQLNDRDIIDKVLPPKPDVIMKAADILYPDKASPERRLYPEKALGLLPPVSEEATDAKLRATLLHELGKREEAKRWYEAAIEEDQKKDRKNWNWDLHYEYAMLLYEMKNWKDAERELDRFIKGDQSNPKKKEATELLNKIKELGQLR